MPDPGDKPTPKTDPGSNKQKVLRSLREKVDGILIPEPVDFPDEPRTESCEIESICPGQTIQTPLGSCYIVKSRHDIGAFHGHGRFRQALDSNRTYLAQLLGDPALADLDPRSALYLDTETTGLSAREGDFAFMIGLGYFDGDLFRVAQIFLRDHTEEPAALYELERIARRFSHLVTFNGKNFDGPLLDTRLALGRFDFRFGSMPHIDLLGPARRLWKYRLTSCSLGSLEKDVLGFVRGPDIPGFEIPDLYRDYVKTRDAKRLRSVFDHNVKDVLSMVVLLAKIDRILHGKNETPLVPEENFALGRIHLAFDRQDLALPLLKDAAKQLGPELMQKALRDVSLVLRGQKRFDEAAKTWLRMVEEKPEQLFAYEQLAIYLEHRAKDYPAALQVLDAGDRHVVFSSYVKKQQWHKRRARILAKLEKAGRKP